MPSRVVPDTLEEDFLENSEAYLEKPTDILRELVKKPLTLDGASSFENYNLAKALGCEAGAIFHHGPAMKNLAASPMWRLMAAQLVAAKTPEELQVIFLLHSARLMSSGEFSLGDENSVEVSIADKKGKHG